MLFLLPGLFAGQFSFYFMADKKGFSHFQVE